MATYELIQTQTVSSSGSITSLDFTSIPQTYQNLVVKLNSRSSTANTYANVFWAANGASTGSSAGKAGTYYAQNASQAAPSYTTISSAWIADMNAANNYTAAFGNAEITITGYTKTTASVKGYSVISTNPDTGVGNIYPEISGGYLSVSGAINRLTFYIGAGTWDAGSYISLYGIKSI